MNQPFSMRRTGMVLLASAAACLAAVPVVRAQQAASINNLRGTYTGSYTSNSGGDSGNLTLKITKDKNRNGARAVKGTAKFGRKTYKLTGAFEPTTRQLNLAAAVGRPPRITQVTLTGFFNEDATSFEGGFTITSQASHNAGDASLTRRGR